MVRGSVDNRRIIGVEIEWLEKNDRVYKEIEDGFKKQDFNPIFRKSHFRVENIVTKDFIILIRRYSHLTQ